MNHDDLVFEALSHLRHLGADAKDIRKHVRQRGVNDDRASLTRLSKQGLIAQVGRKWFITAAGQKRARGTAVPPAWQTGDTLILMALLISSRDKGCDLADIIGAADYIDHGTPTLEAVHGALNRLVSGGLAKTRRGRFYYTEKAASMHEKLEGVCRRGVRSRLRGLTSLLDCPCCGVQLRKVTWRIVLDEAQMKEALKAYRQAFAKS